MSFLAIISTPKFLVHRFSDWQVLVSGGAFLCIGRGSSEGKTEDFRSTEHNFKQEISKNRQNYGNQPLIAQSQLSISKGSGQDRHKQPLSKIR